VRCRSETSFPVITRVALPEVPYVSATPSVVVPVGVPAARFPVITTSCAVPVAPTTIVYGLAMVAYSA
jgi:hypothetical protein